MSEMEIRIDFNRGTWICGDGCCYDSWWTFAVIINSRCVYESHEITWSGSAAEIAAEWLIENGYRDCKFDVDVCSGGYNTSAEMREIMDEVLHAD